MISFKAFVCLLETPLASDAQDIIIAHLSKIETSHYLSHSRYLKLLESFITCLGESKIGFMIDIISISPYEFIQSKQGYFLIRKLLKYTKLENLQIQITKSFASDIHRFVECQSGLLLLQCLIKYFSKAEIAVEAVPSNSLSFNKKIMRKVLNMECKENNPSNKVRAQQKHLSIKSANRAVIEIFKTFVNKIVSSYSSSSYDETQKRGHKKLLSLFISYCGEMACECLLTLISIRSSSQQLKLVIEIINVESSLKIVASLLKYEMNKNNSNFARLCCQLKIMQIPEKYHAEWNALLSRSIQPLLSKSAQFNFKSANSCKLAEQDISIHTVTKIQDKSENFWSFDEFVLSNKSFFDLNNTNPSIDLRYENNKCIAPQIIRRPLVQTSRFPAYSTNQMIYPYLNYCPMSNLTQQASSWYTSSKTSMPVNAQPLYFSASIGAHLYSFTKHHYSK